MGTVEMRGVGVRPWMVALLCSGWMFALAGAVAAQDRGYQPRDCGFDMNRNGIVGEPADCNVCNGGASDGDADGSTADVIYVSCAADPGAGQPAGFDTPGCGAPGNPCLTIGYAFETIADGPGDGAEDIVCFRNTCVEENLSPRSDGGGVPGTYTRPATGSEARDWPLPSDPVMLVGWDVDADGVYPPHDPDHAAVLAPPATCPGLPNQGCAATPIINPNDNRERYHQKIDERAVFLNNDLSHVEMAHFTVRDYGRHTLTYNSGFFQLHQDPNDLGPTVPTEHVYLHDIEMHDLNRDSNFNSRSSAINAFGWRAHHVAFENLLATGNGHWFARGGGSYGPPEAGPFRWKNVTLTLDACVPPAAVTCDSQSDPGCASGNVCLAETGCEPAPGESCTTRASTSWKLWGYYSEIEILDSVLDAGVLAQPNAVRAGVARGIVAKQCSQDWTIRNNELIDFNSSVEVTPVSAGACDGDKDPNGTITRLDARPVTDIVIDRNLIRHPAPVGPFDVGILLTEGGGDFPGQVIGDTTITNNVITSRHGFEQCMWIRAGHEYTGSDPAYPPSPVPGAVTIVNNTCWGPVTTSGALLIGRWNGANQPYLQENFVVRNNVVAGIDSGTRNVMTTYAPTSFDAATNVWDPDAGFRWNATTGSVDLATWSGLSGDTGSTACIPQLQSADGVYSNGDARPANGEVHWRPTDTCAQDMGSDASAYTVVDLDGGPRPQGNGWDAGADEATPPDPDDPPLRLDGGPFGTLPAGTSSVTLTLSTYHAATCSVADAADVAYGDPTRQAMTADAAGTQHSFQVTGLTEGDTASYFIRCASTSSGNVNDTDEVVTFQVAAGSGTDAFWSFDEASGCDVLDGTGGHDGTMQPTCPSDGPSRITGVQGGGLDFDGSNDYVEVPPHADLAYTSSFTAAAWIRPASYGDNGYGRIVSTQQYTSGFGPGFSLYTADRPTGDPVATRSLCANVDTAIGCANDDALTLGVWQHVAVVFDDAQDTVRFYVNGFDRGGFTTATTLRASTAPLHIGDRDGLTRSFHGAIDEVGVWGRALSSVEIGDLSELPGTPPVRSQGGPTGALPTGTTTATLTLTTHKDATCRFADSPGVAYASMVDTFASTDGLLHTADVPVVDDQLYRFQARCEDTAGNANPDDYEIAFSVGFHPADLANVLLFVESRQGFSLTHGSDLADFENFCTRDLFPEGCVRRWQDQSGYVRPSTPLFVGRDFGQDDAEKPGLIPDCINGWPCVRGGSENLSPDLGQDLSFEIEASDHIRDVSGAFSAYLLTRPVVQPANHAYFGFAGNVLLHQVTDDSLRLQIDNASAVVTGPGALVADGAFHLVEVHRDAAGQIRLLVDGADVTLGSPVLSGDFDFSFLFSLSREQAMHGDMAAFLLVDGALGAAESDVRSYFATVYGVPGTGGPAPPVRSQGSPSGTLPAGTTSVTLSVQTDVAATCDVAGISGVSYGDPARQAMTADAAGTLHTLSLAGLSDGDSVTRFVRCAATSDPSLVNTDDYTILFDIATGGGGGEGVARWPFDEASGCTATDTLGGHDGTLGPACPGDAPVRVAGMVGGALDFDGVNDVVTVPHHADLAFTGSFTASAWIRPTDFGDNSYGRIVSKQQYVSGFGPGYSIYIGNQPSGSPAGTQTLCANVDTMVGCGDANSIAVGVWQHVAVVFDDVLDEVRFYVDGVQRGGFAASLTLRASTVPLHIGDREDLARSFHGAIDEVTLWDRALDASEIAGPQPLEITTLDDTMADDGLLSLREAIDAVNAGGLPNETEIRFAPSLSGTVRLSHPNGTLLVTESLVLLGDGRIEISGDANDSGTLDAYDVSVFVIDATSGPVRLEGLVITGGYGQGADISTASAGGGVFVRNGTVVIDNCHFQGNRADIGGAVAQNDLSDVTVRNTTFVANHGNTFAGALCNNRGTATIEDSVFQGNTSGFNAGAIYNLVGVSMDVRRSSIVGNQASFHFGGILNTLGVLSVDSSTISGNTANRVGGGLGALGGTTTVHQTTISGNQSLDATNGGGGGIYAASDADLGIAHSTVANNSAAAPGGGIQVVGGTTSLSHVLFAGNGASSGDDVDGVIISTGYNLFAQASVTGTVASDQTGTAVALGPLGDNGGPTETHAPASGSATIDAGDPALAGAPADDQRGAGFPRVLDGDGDGAARVDIGAVEAATALAGPRAYWPLDETSGTVAFDQSGNGLDGTLAAGLGWTTGQVGGALQLGGADPSVVISPALQLAGPSSVTMAAWIRHGTATDFHAIIDQRDAGADGYDLFLEPGSRAFLRINNHTLTGTTVVADGTWHHVVGTYDGNVLAIYVDGVLDASATVGATVIDTTAAARLGDHYSVGVFRFTGTLDEVRIYDRAVNGGEVVALFQDGGTGTPDTTPPTRTNGAPTGTLAAGTSSATLSLDTDEPAQCRYDESAGTAYAAMANAFSTSGGATHATTVSGLVDGASYTYYVRCQDSAGNANGDDLAIAFSVAAASSGGSLIAHWRLDETSGVAVADASGFAHGGTLIGSGTWISGRIGGGLSVTGGSHVQVPGSSVLDTPQALTIAAWVRHQPVSDFAAIVDKRDAVDDGYDLYLSAASRPFLRINDATLEGATVVTDGAWHHLAAVWDGNQMRLYVDGQLDASQTIASTTLDVQADLRIGRNFNSGFALSGDLDDVRIYDEALAASEIAALAQPGGTLITLPPWADRTVFQRVGTAVDVPLSGIFTGGSGAIEAQVLDAMGNAVISWSTVDATPSGGTWSGTLTGVPEGGWYEVAVRFVNDPGTVWMSQRFGVGVIVATLGQSNMAKMFTEISFTGDGDLGTVNPAMPDDRARRYGYGRPRISATDPGGYLRLDGGTYGWGDVTGVGATRLANELVAALDAPVLLLDFAIDGTSIGQWTDPTWPNWQRFAAGVADVGGDFEALLWYQGYSDIAAGTSGSAYTSALDTLYAQLSALLPSTRTLRFVSAVQSRGDYGGSLDAAYNTIRQAQLDWIDARPEVYAAGNSIDVDLAADSFSRGDGHFTASQYAFMADRYSRGLLQAIGTPGFAAGVRGGAIVSAAVTGTQVTVQVNQDQGSALQLLDPAADVEGFELSTDGFATVLRLGSGIASAVLSGDQTSVILTLDNAPTGPLELRYLYGQNPFGHKGTTAARRANGNVLYDNFVYHPMRAGLPINGTTVPIAVN